MSVGKVEGPGKKNKANGHKWIVEDNRDERINEKEKLLFPLLLAKGYFSDPMTRIDITELTQLVKSKTKLNDSRYFKFIFDWIEVASCLKTTVVSDNNTISGGGKINSITRTTLVQVST